MSDPFRHHPGLKGKISDPEDSFFRDFTLEKLRAIAVENNLPLDWWFSDADREAHREVMLRDRRNRDLWVFGVASLMWDPGVHFAEVRRARLTGYHRAFILKDIYGGRGTAERPALMAALAEGGACDGLVFRLPRERLEEETTILWQREFLAPGYVASFLKMETEHGEVEALACVANPASEMVVGDIDRATQVQYMATASGFLGTSADYLKGVAEKLRELGIEDAEVEGLWADVAAYEGD